jgi:predicted SAM-dependent methyltransferase
LHGIAHLIYAEDDDLELMLTMAEQTNQSNQPLRLNIGGTESRAGWKILNIQPGPNVDFIGDCTDLSQFASDSVDEVYASHVYEHLNYMVELPKALAEVFRVLKPGGTFKVGVPDLDVLCRLYIHPGLNFPDRYFVMRMIYGGQTDPYDFHKVGLNWEILTTLLANTGFKTARRVKFFELFNDCSAIVFAGEPISLNVEASKSS